MCEVVSLKEFRVTLDGKIVVIKSWQVVESREHLFPKEWCIWYYNFLQEAMNTLGIIKEVDLSCFSLIFKERECLDQLREVEQSKINRQLIKR